MFGLTSARLFLVALTALLLVSLVVFLPASSAGVAVHASNEVAPGARALPATLPAVSLSTVGFLPHLQRAYNSTAACQAAGETYNTLSVNPPSTDRAAEQHADLNLALRGYQGVTADKSLVVYGGSSDPKNPPQLPGLFADNRTATVGSLSQIYDWNWTSNSRGSLLNVWEATLAGLNVTPGETIYVPASGYDVGSGYQALVLYASDQRITLKYSNADNVVSGYTIHIENICVDPGLLSLYVASDAAGRSELPALNSGQGLGRALSSQIGVATRSDGAFLDPRSKNDWWRGR